MKRKWPFDTKASFTLSGNLRLDPPSARAALMFLGLVFAINILSLRLLHIDLSPGAILRLFTGNIISYGILLLIFNFVRYAYALVTKHMFQFSLVVLSIFPVIELQWLPILTNMSAFGTLKLDGRYIVENEIITSLGIKFVYTEIATAALTILLSFLAIRLASQENSTSS